MAPLLGTTTSQLWRKASREQEPSTPSIEKLFAKIKHWLGQGQARSREAVHRELRTILDASPRKNAQLTSRRPDMNGLKNIALALTGSEFFCRP